MGRGGRGGGAYVTMMGSREATFSRAAGAPPPGVARALVENSLSTDWRWKLFMAQKGIRRAPVFRSGTP